MQGPATAACVRLRPMGLRPRPHLRMHMSGETLPSANIAQACGLAMQMRSLIPFKRPGGLRMRTPLPGNYDGS